jgi:3-dehydroquinate synthase
MLLHFYKFSGIQYPESKPFFTPSTLETESTFKNNMSNLKASVSETKTLSGHAGFHVEGYEKIEYDFTFIDGVFDVNNPNLAECYKRWGRCLAVTDLNIHNVYGKRMERYFQHYGLELKIHKTKIGEKAKTIPTLLSIVDSMNEFGIYRKVCTLVIDCLQTFDVY